MSIPCSQATREQGEPLAGTAGVVAALVGISWPKALWDPDEAARSEGLPDEIWSLISDEKRSGRKIAVRLFQRAPRPPTDDVELLALVPQKRRTLHLRELPVGEIATRVHELLHGRSAGPPLSEPLALICTDGRHDRCCAIRGRRVYEAVQSEAGRRGLRLRVVESSHLGGHRFAATCLLLPAGEMYGRLLPEDAPSLVDAFGEGRVFTPRFRGRLGTPEPLQVAEVYLRARYPEAGDLELTLEENSEGVALVHSGTLEIDVECRLRSFSAPTSCSKAESEERLRWVAAGSSDLSEGPDRGA